VNSNKKSQTSTIERNWADGAEDAVCADQRGGDYYDAEGEGGGGGGASVNGLVAAWVGSWF